MMDWSDDGSWMNGWGIAFMVIVWVAVIGVVVWAVVRTTGQSRVDSAQESPRQILDRRLAAGEVSPTEYSIAVDLLEGRTHGAAPPG